VQVRKADAGDTLRWPRVIAFESDAVTAEGASSITEADDDVAALLGMEHRLAGKRVLHGRRRARQVTDVEFDGGSGSVTRLRLDDHEVAGVRLRGVGSYAVVVTAE